VPHFFREPLNKGVCLKKVRKSGKFVHNKQIYEKIKELDFDYAQGFYIGKPDKNLSIGKNLDYLK